MQESDCDSNNATLNEPLDQAGFYTLAVTDGNNDATFDYDLNVQCIGACENFVPSCDEIFSDGFESGDTSAWSASQ